jgi:hypothetical protein
LAALWDLFFPTKTPSSTKNTKNLVTLSGFVGIDFFPTKTPSSTKNKKNLVTLSGFVGFIFSHEDTKKHKEYNKTKNLVTLSGFVGIDFFPTKTLSSTKTLNITIRKKTNIHNLKFGF